ncbi:hypothetical protein FPV67DRAFT_77041 [Lyophyllum atratum]|nr:hypothetical protein FPV67DRAFT_77041 [Lyophyllum atratum]
MSLSSSSSTREKFANPEHFTQSGSLDEWFCNICTKPSSKHVDYMTLRAAQHHERHSAEHGQNVTAAELQMWGNTPDPTDWTAPLKHDRALTAEEVKMRESRAHVDLVQDMVQFWIRGVEAAERGEVLRLEQFLETLQEASDSWVGANAWANDPVKWGNGWAAEAPDDGWGAVNSGEWGVGNGSMGRIESSGEKRRQGTIEAKGSGRKGRQHNQSNAYEFVEDVARQEAADEERKRRMHHFFKMPTDEKVKKIDEVIRDLLATA